MKKKQINIRKLLFETHLQELGLRYRSEYRFHKARKWRWDWILPDYMIAIELQGGGFVRGRHSRGAGMQEDMDKFNEGVRAGWKLLLFSTLDIDSGKAREFLRSWLCPGVKR